MYPDVADRTDVHGKGKWVSFTSMLTLMACHTTTILSRSIMQGAINL
jgi:hypothetical protein